MCALCVCVKNGKYSQLTTHVLKEELLLLLHVTMCIVGRKIDILRLTLHLY